MWVRPGGTRCVWCDRKSLRPGGTRCVWCDRKCLRPGGTRYVWCDRKSLRPGGTRYVWCDKKGLRPGVNRYVWCDRKSLRPGVNRYVWCDRKSLRPGGTRCVWCDVPLPRFIPFLGFRVRVGFQVTNILAQLERHVAQWVERWINKVYIERLESWQSGGGVGSHHKPRLNFDLNNVVFESNNQKWRNYINSFTRETKEKQFHSDDNVRASFFTVLCGAEYLLLLVMFAPCDLETVCIYQWRGRL